MEIAVFSQLIDRIISLLKIREKRLQRRFDEFWSPAFKELEQVHGDYQRMFYDIEAIMKNPSVSTEDVENLYENAINFLKSKRLELAPVRDRIAALDSLRMNDEYVSMLRQEEVNFLHSLVAYIRPVSLPNWLGSRSSTLLSEIEQAATLENRSAEAALERIQMHEKRKSLDADWRAASSAFHELRLYVMNNST